MQALLSKHSLVAPCMAQSRPVAAPRSMPNLRARAFRVQVSTGNATITPVVKIDNISDAFATMVTVEFGKQGQTAELLDAVMALKNLGLNIRKAKLTGGSTTANTFFITDAYTSEKIIRSARLEDIRLTLISSLMEAFPETSSSFTIKSSSMDEGPKLGGRKVVQTTIEVNEAKNGSCSVLKITTNDRPGLLVDIVRVLKDINLNVVSAEIDTEGPLAKDEFFVTYHGEPLSSNMVTLTTNALQYYLSLSEIATAESY